jgi:hypothetical protein
MRSREYGKKRSRLNRTIFFLLICILTEIICMLIVLVQECAMSLVVSHLRTRMLSLSLAKRPRTFSSRVRG